MNLDPLIISRSMYYPERSFELKLDAGEHAQAEHARTRQDLYSRSPVQLVLKRSTNELVA